LRADDGGGTRRDPMRRRREIMLTVLCKMMGTLPSLNQK
jgi:hypothetical protein